jgi:hypothetical protein
MQINPIVDTKYITSSFFVIGSPAIMYAKIPGTNGFSKINNTTLADTYCKAIFCKQAETQLPATRVHTNGICYLVTLHIEIFFYVSEDLRNCPIITSGNDRANL